MVRRFWLRSLVGLLVLITRLIERIIGFMGSSGNGNLDNVLRMAQMLVYVFNLLSEFRPN